MTQLMKTSEFLTEPEDLLTIIAPFSTQNGRSSCKIHRTCRFSRTADSQATSLSALHLIFMLLRCSNMTSRKTKLFTDFSCSHHRTHMQDLQEVTQDLHYENFRSDRLKRGGRLSSHGYVLPLSPAYVSLLLCTSPTSNSQPVIRSVTFSI